MKNSPQVSIIMGSDSDLPVMREAEDILNKFGVRTEMKILSAHRSPEETAGYVKTAKKRGIKVIIAGAGGAAHLAGVAASFTVLPVIGVPIESKSLKGMDSLLSIVQMPSGVPVATVAIGGAKNAGILAAQMIALSDGSIADKLVDYKKSMAENIREKNSNISKK